MLYTPSFERDEILAMKPTRVRYCRRINLENYNHEELEVEYVLEEGSKDSAREVLLQARKDVAISTTSYLAAQKAKEQKGEGK